MSYIQMSLFAKIDRNKLQVNNTGSFFSLSFIERTFKIQWICLMFSEMMLAAGYEGQNQNIEPTVLKSLMGGYNKS